MPKITEDDLLKTHHKNEIHYDYFVGGYNIQIYQYTVKHHYNYWVRIRPIKLRGWIKGEITTNFNTALDLLNTYRREILKNT